MPSALDSLLAASQNWGVKKRPPVLPPTPYNEPTYVGSPDDIEGLLGEARSLGSDTERLIASFGQTPVPPPNAPTVDDLYSGETPPLPPRPASMGPHGILGPRPLPIPAPPEEPEAPSFYGNENVGRPEALPRKPTFMEQLNESPIGDATLMPIRDRAIEALPQSIRTLYETAKAKAGELIEPIKRVAGYPLRAFGNIKDTAVELPIALGEAISGQPLPGHAHAPGASLDEILAADEEQRRKNLLGEGESVPMQSVGFLEAALGRNPAEQFRASGPLDRLIAAARGERAPEMVQTPAIERVLTNAGLQTADTALGMATDPGIAMMLGAGAGGGIGRKALDLMFQYEGAKGLVEGANAASVPTPEGVDAREAAIEKASNLGGSIGSAGVFFGPSVVPALRGKAAEVGAIREGKQQAITQGVQEAFGKEVSEPRKREIDKLFEEGMAPTPTSQYVRPSVRRAMTEIADKQAGEYPTPVPPKPEGWERKAWSPENAEPMPPGAAKFMARDEIAAAEAKKKATDIAAASLANEGKRPPKPVDPRQLKLYEEAKAAKSKASLAKNYPEVARLTKVIEDLAGEQPVYPEADPFVFDSPTQPKGGAETQLPLKPGEEPPPPAAPVPPVAAVPPPPPAPAAPPPPAPAPARQTTIADMLNGPPGPSRAPAPKPPTAIVPETKVAKGIIQPGLPVAEDIAPVQRRYTPEPAPAPPVEAKPQTIEELIAGLTGGKPEPKVETVEPGAAPQANASGESAASIEAQNRQKAMDAKGQKFAIVDAGGNLRPLLGADAVDVQPRGREAKVILNADGTTEFVSGDPAAVRAIKPPAAPEAPKPAPAPAPPEDSVITRGPTGQPAVVKDTTPRENPKTGEMELDPDAVLIRDTSVVGVDPKAYQFKESEPGTGVTGALAGVKEWDPNSPPVLIHQRADGSLWIADGHQRFAKYNELKAQGKQLPPLKARIVREGDGYTVDVVRRAASLRNVQEGSATPMDIAKLLRTGPLSAGELDRIPKGAMTGARLRHGQGLSELSEEAFREVINGMAHPEAVSQVAKYFTNPAEQVAAIRMVGKKEITNPNVGEAYVKELARGMLDKKLEDSQIILPGMERDQQFVDLAEVRAKLVTSTERMLVKRKGFFNAALKGAPELEGAGNRLDPESNAKVAADTAKVLAYFEKFADAEGSATNKAIRELARELYAKRIDPAAATDQLVDAIRRDIETGGTGTGEAAPGAAEGQPARPGADGQLAQGPEAVPPVAQPDASLKEVEEILRKGAEATAKEAPPLADIPLTLTGEKATEGMGEPTKKELEAAGQTDMFAEPEPPKAPEAPKFETPKKPQDIEQAITQAPRTYRESTPDEYQAMSRARNAAIDAATQRGTDLLKKVRASKAKAEGLFEQGGAQAVIDYWNKVTAEIEKRPVTNTEWTPPERIADNAEVIAPPNKDFVIVRFEGRATPEQSAELKAAGFKFKEGEWIGNVEGPTNRVGRPREDLIADAKRIAKGEAVRDTEPVASAATEPTSSSTSLPVQPESPIEPPKPVEPPKQAGEMTPEGEAIIERVKPQPQEAIDEALKKIGAKPAIEKPEEQTTIGEAVQKKVDEAIEKLPDEPAPKRELDTMLEGKQDIYDQLPPNVRSYLTKRAELSREDINNFGSVEEAVEYGKKYGENERAKAEAAKQEAARAAAGQPKKLTPIEDLANPKEPLDPKVEQWAKLIEADLAGKEIVDREEYGDFFRDRANAIRRAQAIQAEIKKLQDELKQPEGQAPMGAVLGPDVVTAAQELAKRYEAQQGEGAVVSEREMMRQAREREALIANGSPLALRRYGDFLQKVAARLNEKTLRGGTSTKKVEAEIKRTEGGEIIGSGFGALEGMITLAKKNPAAFKRIMAAAGVGGLIGASKDDEDRVMGFLMGAAAGATAGAMMPASTAQLSKLKSAAEKLRVAGREPGNMKLRREPRADRDLKWWEVLLPLNPETVVPEAYRKASRIMDELNNEMAYGKLAEQERAVQKSVSGDYVKEAVRTLRELSKDAKNAGFDKKAIYINRMADALSKRPTAGQVSSKQFAEGIGLDKLYEKAGSKLTYDWLERATGITTYRVLTGYALDTALQNLTQPILALRHVGAADMLWAYKVSRTQWARDMTRHIHLIRPTDLEETSPGVTETKDVSEKSTAMDWVKDPQRLIAKSDNFNRRVVYLAAMRAAERNGLMGDYAREWARAVNEQTFTEAYRTEADQWARSVMRDTQGDIGPLSVNPLYRGPIGGSIRPFTKFPTLLFRNLLDAAFQPDATGRNRFLMATAAAVFLGKQAGLDLEDTLLMGGRPFGIDITNPREALKKITSLDVFPVAKGATDVWKHVQGTANHPVLPSSLDDFFNSDLSYVGLTRYGTKVGSFVKRTIDEGAGDRVVRTPSGAVKTITTLEDLIGLSGFKASRPNQLAKVTSEASGEMYQAAADRKAKAKEIVRQMRVAYDAHDTAKLAELQQKLATTTRSSKAVINAMQGIDRSQWERILRQADPRTRALLNQKYGELIEALSIGK